MSRFIDALPRARRTARLSPGGRHLCRRRTPTRRRSRRARCLRGRRRQGGRLDALCPRDRDPRRRPRRAGRFRRRRRRSRARSIALLVERSRPQPRCRERAYARGRTMIWPRLAEAAMARDRRDRRGASPRRLAKAPAPLTPLTPDFAAVERMSDATGMLQHSIYSVPDRRHGYCIDDNARALMLMSAIARSRRRRARQVDDDLRVVRPICLEPGHAALPQLHELRPDLVRGCRVGGFERPHALGARRHRARCAGAPSTATGRCALFDETASHRARTRSARARRRSRCSARRRCSSAHPGHAAVRATILERFADELLDAARRARAGPNGNGSRSCSPMTMRACPRR